MGQQIKTEHVANRVSLTPGFSRVFASGRNFNRFSGFPVDESLKWLCSHEVPFHPAKTGGCSDMKNSAYREISPCRNVRNWCRLRLCSAISLSSTLRPSRGLPCG